MVIKGIRKYGTNFLFFVSKKKGNAKITKSGRAKDAKAREIAENLKLSIRK